jgi:thiol-disulfide isomerase/thioredoxin
MKKPSFLMTFLLAVSFLLINGGEADQNKNDYLRRVLTALDKIKSAAYFSDDLSGPVDDASELKKFPRYYKEYLNPADPTIGSSFAWFKPADTSKMEYFYDGKIKGFLNWKEKTIRIDTFRNTALSFRVVGPPFFNYTRSIIKYALETEDSISVDVKNLGDSVQFTLQIFGEVVEFFGNDFWYTDVTEFISVEPEDMASRYDIWIHKSDNLPYRLRRIMPHSTSYQTVKNVILNNGVLSNFSPSKYFPPNFSVTSSRAANQKRKALLNNLVGKPAPNWILKDANNNTFSLKELKSKIIAMQFTGIGCGACHASIPFLKQLVNDYKNKDFEFIGIETWSKSIDGVKKYQDRNKLNFKFLRSEETVNKSYEIEAVPQFIILDENRIIRKIITGYTKGVTDREVLKVIEELI